MQSVRLAIAATLAASTFITMPTAAQQDVALVGVTTFNLSIFDPTTGTTTRISQPTEGCEGLTWSHDGMIYLSAWTTNGILKIDPSTGAVVATVCQDPTNLVLGAPYTPVIDNEASGGPGLWCIDGNFTSTSTLLRNTAHIDTVSQTCGIGCTFPTSITPASDALPHPLKCGTFVCVGYQNLDMNVYEFVRNGSTGPCAITTLCTLPAEAHGNAFIHDDDNLYVWGYDRSLPAFTGLMKVDLRTGVCSTIAITSAFSNAAVWNEPHGFVGRDAWAYIDQGDRVIRVDLTTGAVTPFWSNRTDDFDHARERHASQLTSWVDASNPAKRTFHVNFSRSNYSGADRPTHYLLVPSTLTPSGGSTPPATFNVPRQPSQPPILIEAWFVPDVFSYLAVTGALSPLYKAYGSLDANQEADVVVDTTSLGLPTSTCMHWIAFAWGPRGAIDVSNRIPVRIH